MATPVLSESTRVGQAIDYDKLTIEVWTDGTINAQEAVSLAARVLTEHLNLFVNLSDEAAGAEIMVAPLARVGLVKSERGSQGGYRLTKAPADYTAGEILRAIEGSVAPIPCLGSETNECPMSDQCFTLPFWAGLDDVINQYIDSVTLEQLAQSLPAVKEGCGCCGTKS